MIEVVLPSAHPSPQPKWQIDRFSHFCTAHGRVSSGTLVPPGEYDWILASFIPPESTVQMTNQSVQPFLHSWRQKVPILYNVRPFPPKLPFAWGHLDHLIHDSLGYWAHNTNSITIGSAVFTQVTAKCPCTLQWAPLSPKLPLPIARSGTPSNLFFEPIWAHNPNGISIGSSNLQGSLVWQTDRPTDHATWSVTVNRIYVRSMDDAV